jgi:hypothetical protein
VLVEYVRCLYRARLRPALRRVWERLGEACGEARHRLWLTAAVLRGKVPYKVKRRPWDRRHDCPSVMDVYDLYTDDVLFTVLVWPDLREPPCQPTTLRRVERAKVIFRMFQQVAPELARATTWEVDHTMDWNSHREVWVRRDDGMTYQGPADSEEEGAA